MTRQNGDAPLRVLFVCTGNTCRSPMAQAVLTALRPEICALSAGLYPVQGEPITPQAVQALHDAGILCDEHNPYESHTATPVDELTVLSCDRIIGMTERHAMQLLMQYPAAASKISAMPPPIADPFGGTVEQYRACLAQITAGIREMFP